MKPIIQSKKSVILMIIVIAIFVSVFLWRNHQYVKLLDSIGVGDNETVVELIEKYNFDLDKPSGHFPWKYLPGFDELNSPLEIACECGNNEAAFILIEHGADASIIRKGGFSPIYLAMRSTELDDYELIKTLIEKGADVNEMGVDQDVLVRCAYMFCGDYEFNTFAEKYTKEKFHQEKYDNQNYDVEKANEVVKIYKFLEKQRGTVKEFCGVLPLRAAVSRQNFALIEYLLDDENVDINDVDSYGKTCAFGLIDYDRGKKYNRKRIGGTFKLLIDNGLDLSIRNNDGETFKEKVQEIGDEYLLELIEQYE